LRFPVTEEDTGSNPVRVAKQFILRWISGRSSALQADETGSIPVRSAKHIPVVKWIITKLYESLVQGSSPCRGTKHNGDYSVMAAPNSVKVIARDRYPLVTPKF